MHETTADPSQYFWQLAPGAGQRGSGIVDNAQKPMREGVETHASEQVSRQSTTPHLPQVTRVLPSQHIEPGLAPATHFSMGDGTHSTQVPSQER